jgi:hypothetical protein
MTLRQREPRHDDRDLLDVAHDAPCMLRLGVEGCGHYPSVPCHSDMLRHGRGVGGKSHDCFAVAGCPACHAAFTRANLGREGYEAAWLAALERYLVWMWANDKLRVA